VKRDREEETRGRGKGKPRQPVEEKTMIKK
jgi:hypothetical protein